MGQRTWNRDYYEPNPAQGVHDFERDVKKLKEKESPPPPTSAPAPADDHARHVRAGERLERAAALECEACDARYGLLSEAEVPPCGRCGSELFHTVS